MLLSIKFYGWNVAFVFSTFLLIKCNILNEKPHFQTACSWEKLNIRCKQNQRIVMNSLSLGEKSNSYLCNQTDGMKNIGSASPKYRSTCCSINQSDDCIQKVDNVNIHRACTGSRSCVYSLKNIPHNVTCKDNSSERFSPDYESVTYFCIDDSRFEDCFSASLRSCTDGQTLYLSSPGYPTAVSTTSMCSCRITSDCPGNITFVPIDLNITGLEYILYNDSRTPLYVTNRDKTVISEQYISSTDYINFKSIMRTGRFLVAIKADCTVRVQCPGDSEDGVTVCNRSDEKPDFPWWWVLLAVILSLCPVCSFFVYRCFKKGKYLENLKKGISKKQSSQSQSALQLVVDGDVIVDNKSVNSQELPSPATKEPGIASEEPSSYRSGIDVPPIHGTLTSRRGLLPPIYRSADDISNNESSGNNTSRSVKKKRKKKKKAKVEPEMNYSIHKKDLDAIKETFDLFSSDLTEMNDALKYRKSSSEFVQDTNNSFDSE